MRYLYSALLASLCSICIGAPPEVPSEIAATPGQLIRIPVKTEKKIGTAKNFTDADGFFGELVAPAGQRQFVFQPPVTGAKSSYVLTFWTEGELEGSTCTITVTGVIPVPPTPPGPNPNPTPDTDPLKSFRVIFIYESGDTLTTAQRAVVFGRVTEDYLNANCTGGKTGWRRRDKDAPGETDPTFSAMWQAIKPNVTTLPCVAVERNGKVTIINLDATPAAMVATLQKYKGGN